MTEWKLVPVEPTAEMRAAGLEPLFTENVRDASENGRCGRIYRSMLEAAPPAPSVRDAALEEAAKIVERYSLPTIQAPSMWLIDKASIANDIRALKEKAE